jgi:pimeloyl-ACP methyl ester carboxylesterase
LTKGDGDATTRRVKRLLLALVPLAVVACSSAAEETTAEDSALTTGHVDPSHNPANPDAIAYRPLDGHPGCTTVGLETRAAGCPAIQNPTAGSYSGDEIATIPGYKCAAKAYASAAEDPNKPILLLVHGNSDVPSVFDAAGGSVPMLAEEATRLGFHVLAVDLRFDKVDDPHGNNVTENLAQNFNHGWAVPIAEHFIDSVMTAFPHRSIAIVGFSEGATVARDALRRLHRANKKPFERVKAVVLAAGANHGVVNGAQLCTTNPTMRGKVGCELGDRAHFATTPFLASLNGPNGAFETPCLDGNTAFGQRGVCGGHKVHYTTVVVQDDLVDGVLREEFVSQQSSALSGANNVALPPATEDTSRYFCDGIFKTHYASIRTDGAITRILNAVTSP